MTFDDGDGDKEYDDDVITVKSMVRAISTLF
jgi:hypothetical protein